MKRTWFIPISIASLIALYTIVYAWRPGGVALLRVLTDTLFAIFALLATALAWRASRLFEPGVAQRRVWLLLSAGMAVLTSAQLLWIYYHIILGQTETRLSPADVLWAICYFPILASLILQYRALGIGTSLRFKWIVFVIYLAALVVTLVILLWPVLTHPGSVAAIEILVMIYYLVCDLSMIFVAALSLLILWHGLVSRPWQYIIIGILVLALTDLVFAYGVWNNLYATGSNVLSGVVDAGYLLANVVAAAGAYQQVTLSLPPLHDE
jgi:hypothetical protein